MITVHYVAVSLVLIVFYASSTLGRMFFLNSGSEAESVRTGVRKIRSSVNEVVVVVSHIQRIGCQPEKNYFTRWPIPLVVC